jgi:hypothetical protein
MDLKRLRRELRQDRNTVEARKEIICKYARLKSDGAPVLCAPGKNVRAGGDPFLLHSDWKVIYDSVEAARDCERELREQLGALRRWVYHCRRSRHGHVHLTTKRP